MAHVNTAQLIANTTCAVSLLDRAYRVQQDPAVKKAWGEAAADGIEAGRSLSRAIGETLAAWRRTAAPTNSPANT